jgi:hypothetical protein
LRRRICPPARAISVRRSSSSSIALSSVDCRLDCAMVASVAVASLVGPRLACWVPTVRSIPSIAWLVV